MTLLSSFLHNWYRHKNLQQKSWFSDPAAQPQEIRVGDATETLKLVETWNVRDAISHLPREKYKIKRFASDKEGSCGYLGSAILSLTYTQFDVESISKKGPANTLSTMDEIIYNSIWRFLALREYVNADHRLTPWGRVLATALDGVEYYPQGGKSTRQLDNATELEEAIFIAVELLRMGILNADINMFPAYNGAPMRGSTKDQQFNMLFSRVAGLAELRHKPIGFTGPLSQHLLGYNSIINIVRQSLRDLMETTVTNMFLTGCCDRSALDLSELATKLPFLLPNNCALSIATKSYLDELLSGDASDPTDDVHKQRVLQTASERYFPQSIDFAGDLKKAHRLWNSVFAGVSIVDKYHPLPEATLNFWKETNEWLKGRL